MADGNTALKTLTTNCRRCGGAGIISAYKPVTDGDEIHHHKLMGEMLQCQACGHARYEARRPGEVIDTIDVITEACRRIDALPTHAYSPVTCAPIRFDTARRIFEIRTGRQPDDLTAAAEAFPDLAPGFSGLPFLTTYGQVP